MIAALGLLSAAGAQQPSGGLKWYRCNTHTHSSAFPGSDSNGSPKFIAEWYRAHGYACVFITDHEHLTGIADLNQKYKASFCLFQGRK